MDKVGCRRCGKQLGKYAKIFCGRGCYFLTQNRTKRTQQIHCKCAFCSKEWESSLSHAGKFCSIECSRRERIGRPLNRINKKHVLIEKRCLTCDKVFLHPEGFSYQKKYCSKQCHSRNMSYRKYLSEKRTRFTSEEMRRRSLESGRKSYRKHIETRLLYYRQLAAIRRGAEGGFSKEEWEQLKKSYFNSCPACLKPEPEITLTIDHILPLSRGGTNYIKNIQPLCLRCNLRKHTKLIFYPCWRQIFGS